MLTCEAVLAETCFLLQESPGGSTAVLDLVERGVLLVDFQVSTYTKSIRLLTEKYSSVPMSLADACLVKMTELHDDSMVMTLDSDFLIYRRHGRQTIPVLMPPE
jgi:predicted nucleic acid-binding protein